MTLALIDGRDTPACRRLGRAWFKRWRRMIIPAMWLS